MGSFRSSDDLFRAVTDLIGRLETGGHAEAASELRDGFRCLNGLTDGWALFLESILKVEARDARHLPPDDRNALKALRKAVHKAVYRR